MIPQFYIGQQIVALHDHNEHAFKKDDVFTVTGIYPCDCKCGGWHVTIGIMPTISTHYCSICNNRSIPNKVSQRVFKHTHFTPIISTFQSISLKKVLELETPLISVN